MKRNQNKIRNFFLTSTVALTGFFGLVSTSHAFNDVSLINPATNERVGSPITLVRTFDLTEVGNQINFRYNHELPSGPEAQSVSFLVVDGDGNVLSERVENQAPFSAFGDNNGDFNAFNFSGDFISLEVRAYSEKFAQGDIIGGSTYLAQFERSEPTVQTGVSIIEASSDTRVASISNGQTFSMSDIGTSLNFVAEFGDIQDQVGSVVFDQISNDQNGDRVVENAAPFALFGDRNGDFNGQSLSTGSFSFRVRAFSGNNGSGEELSRMTYILNLTE